MTFTPDRTAVVGATAGAAVTLAGALLSGPAGGYLPYSALLILGVALIGLLLGSAAAAWAYAAAALVLVLIGLIGGNALQPQPGDVAQFGIFMLGAPLIVYLILRDETIRRRADETAEASTAAEREAAADRERSEAARLELDRALAAAERERKRLEEVAEAIPEPLIVYDDQLQGTYGNRAALRLFGRSFVERSVEDWGRVALPRGEQGQPLDREQWPQVRGQEEPFRSRLIVHVPMSGGDLMVDVEGTPVPGGGCVLLVRDVGKEEDARRRLSRFASFVAHELRNPLAVAKARIELAHRDPNLGSRAEGHVTRALDSVDAAIGILERLELYSRADSGRVETQREPFALAKAVEAAVERVRARGAEREFRVSVPEGIVVLGDRHLSEQAINNLLLNAERYSTPGGPIHVDAEDGEMVTLRVRDEGPGVDDEVAEGLFRDRVAAARGLGLGLYLVHATMTAMGGGVELEQRTPGAVFALRWMRGEARADEPELGTDQGSTRGSGPGDGSSGDVPAAEPISIGEEAPAPPRRRRAAQSSAPARSARRRRSA